MKDRLKKEIEQLLTDYPETRNSDVTLTIYLWQIYYSGKIGGIDPQDAPDKNAGYVNLKDLYDIPRQDYVKRTRAAFNAEGKFWPTDLKIAKRRGILEDEWRVFMGYPAKADTVNPTKEPSYTEQVNPQIEAKPDERQDQLFDLPVTKPNFRID